MCIIAGTNFRDTYYSISSLIFSSYLISITHNYDYTFISIKLLWLFKDPLEHELGRPELFPSSSYSLFPTSMSAAAAMGGSEGVRRSQFYANTAWYGSSPCLGDQLILQECEAKFL